MAWWGNSKPKEPSIPNNLLRGGLLSHFGGPNAVVQYRVYAELATGGRTFAADPEFQGALIAARRFQSNRDYYVSVDPPVAVVFDRGINNYREVDIDSLKSWFSPPTVPLQEIHPQAVADFKAKREAEAMEIKRKQMIADQDLVKAQMGELPAETGPVKKRKRKSNPFPSSGSHYQQRMQNDPSFEFGNPRAYKCPLCHHELPLYAIEDHLKGKHDLNNAGIKRYLPRLKLINRVNNYANPNLKWHQGRYDDLTGYKEGDVPPKKLSNFQAGEKYGRVEEERLAMWQYPVGKKRLMKQGYGFSENPWDKKANEEWIKNLPKQGQVGDSIKEFKGMSMKRIRNKEEIKGRGKRIRKNPPNAYVVIPITQAAKDWVNENVGLEMWQWTPTEHGMGFGVEWRYYDQLIEGMENDGLIPGYDFNAVA